MTPHLVHHLILIALSSTAFAFQNPTTLEMIPLPQSALTRPGLLSITSQTRIILGDGVTAKDLRLAERFADLVERHLGRRPTVIDEGQLRKLTKGSLYLATPSSDFARSLLSAREIRRLGSASPDEYFLDVRASGIVIVARSERGRFYAMMTLFALLRPQSHRLLLPFVTVRDWPDRPVRGFALVADWSPSHALDRLRRLLPWCGLHKLNTIVVRLTEDARSRWRFVNELPGIERLASEHWVGIQLDSSSSSGAQGSGPELRIGFLPPGPGFTASIALCARGENAPPQALVPSLVLEEPALSSADWLEYCAAWIAQASWSSAQADLGSFNRLYFQSLASGHVGPDESPHAFSALQNSGLVASWDELWIRPSLWGSCNHRVMRRHAAESLTAHLEAHPEVDVPFVHPALAVRLRFLDVVAARLWAEDLLKDLRGPGTTQALAAVQGLVACLDRLEAALLEANAEQALSPEFLDLVGGVSFQRRLWSEILRRIEQDHAYEDLMIPQPQMSTGEEVNLDSADVLEFRRRFQCPETPLQAKLVVSSFKPIVAVANGSVHPGPVPLPSTPSPGHPPTGVIDLTDHLVAGENLLVLTLRASDGPIRAISATLELQFRSGGAATIGVDSLWTSRRRPKSRIPAQPNESWTSVAVTGHPVCQPQSAAPKR